MSDLTAQERRRAISLASYHRRKQPPVLSDHPCDCGCGEFTNIAPRTSAEKGWIKGEPKRFVHGHNRRRYHEPPSSATCRLCKATKLAEEFYKDKSRPTGRSSGCRECLKAQGRAKYAEDPEPTKAQVKRWIEQNPERYRALRQDRQHRRRARMYANEFEKIDRLAIYERDGGKCHICGKRVAKKDMSLDHLTPIARGGDHVKLNVRLAHLSCNVKRGVDRIPAQLLLH
jgi:5-methylcytosine-specific restriction endonuclease McrA